MEENRRLEEDEQGLDTRCDDDDDLHGVVRGRAAACALLLCARRASCPLAFASCCTRPIGTIRCSAAA